MTDLLTHFRAMQAAMTEFMAPDVYIAKTDGKGYKAGARFAHGSQGAAEALLNDVTYMLDGPEQRAAEADYAEVEANAAELAQIAKEAKDRHHHLEQEAKRFQRERDAAVQAREEGRAENNSLRQDVARLSGMLDMLREIGAIPQASGGVVSSTPNTSPYGNVYSSSRYNP